MKVARFWTRAAAPAERGDETFDVEAVGWSFTSAADAVARAVERATHAASMASLRKWGTPHQKYYHDGRMPMREEIVSEVAGDDGQPIAVITRNAYGALVLNSARVMFVDVDFAETPSAPASLLARLLGRAKPSPSALQDKLAELGAWRATRSGWSQRVYATPAGLRVLVTHALFDPLSPESAEAMSAMGADPLYARLCTLQECYRARLTPKPWRCGLPAPTERFPWRNAAAEARFRAWQQRYEAKCAGVAACELIETMGDAMHPEARRIVELHDRTACIAGAKGLA